MQRQMTASATSVGSDRRRVSFCSMPFDMIDQRDVLGMLDSRTLDHPFEYVTTPNVDHVVRTRRDEAALLPLYEDAWMTVCDSRVLAALSSLAGSRLPVTTGADLTAVLFRHAIAPSDRINVVGSDPEVIRRLEAQCHLSQITQFVPPMRLNEQPHEILKCVEFIEQHPARFTFLAVGSPQQEKIAHGVWSRGRAKGTGLCIGTSLEFTTGVVPRAPGWVQGMRLEWLHRLAQEPGRLSRRYLVDDMAIFSIFLRHVVARLASKGQQMRTR